MAVTAPIKAPAPNGNGKSHHPVADPVEASVPAVVIELAQLNSETLRVPIKGTSPLLVHRFSEKARRQMLDAQQGRKSPKEIRDPQADYEDSRYRFADGGDGLPMLAFKDATISAARFYGKAVTMASLKQFLFFTGELSKDGLVLLARIEGEPRMREDYVRINNGRGTDLRYRAEFVEWSTMLTVTYVAHCISRNSVLSLIDAGGLGVGVGDWRPEKGGQNGTYGIDTSRQVEVVR